MIVDKYYRKECADQLKNFRNCLDKRVYYIAPKDTIEEVDRDKFYSDALDYALRNSRIKNIAITGSYGPGKSSILMAYMKQH